MPLDQWVLSVYWQGKAFFAMQVQKSIVTQKVHIIRILFRQYLWQSRNHVSCETGQKGVRFFAPIHCERFSVSCNIPI